MSKGQPSWVQDRNCENCSRYLPNPVGDKSDAEAKSDASGICRRFPPKTITEIHGAIPAELDTKKIKSALDKSNVVMGLRNIVVTYTRFPAVIKDWICGEFVPN